MPDLTMTHIKTVLVTGANGYIGNAVAKAFSRAGWKTFGLVRKPNYAIDLAKDEIYPVIGSPDDISFLDQISGTPFDVIVSNTEDPENPTGHLESVRAMLEELSRRSKEAGIRPLVLFSSGCKDYGKMDAKHGDSDIAGHTEDSPMNPPHILTPRTNFGTSLLKRTDALYDAIVLRPTIVYGYTSSHYGHLFALASEASKSSNSTLEILGDPNTIMHSLHVDDCGDAYVTLAEHTDRKEISQRAFNISNKKYETAQEIGDALAKSFSIKVKFIPTKDISPFSVHSLLNFSQWVASDQLRAITGWTEKRLTFVDGMGQYRIAFEARVGYN